MTRYATFLFLLLVTSVGYGQLVLTSSDSLGVFLKDTFPLEINFPEITFGPCEITVCPIEYPPATKNCVGLTTLSEQKECFITEVKKLIEKEARIPKQIKDSAFTATTYINFVVEQNAEVSKVEVVRSSSYHLPESMKSLAYLLDNEAIQAISKLKFVEPPMIGTKPTRMQFTVPIRYSNPGK